MSLNNLVKQSPFPFDGGCEVLFMAGSPVAQVQTPGILNQRFLEQGLRRLVVPLHLTKEGLPTFLEGMRHLKNTVGLLVTMPHKELLCQISETRSKRAELLGFANVLRITDEGFFDSDCLDGDALIEAIEKIGFKVIGKTALIAGCGGAGAAYAEALIQAGVGKLALVDSNLTRAAELSNKLARVNTGTEITFHSDTSKLTAEVIINASPVGLYRDNECAFSSSTISEAALVVDAVTPTWDTQLIRMAKERGIPCIDGKVLALAQIDSMTRFFWILPVKTLRKN